MSGVFYFLQFASASMSKFAIFGAYEQRQESRLQSPHRTYAF
jgi:hypothetical protein